MNRESRKSEYQRSRFLLFLERSGVNIARDSIRDGIAARKEPDLICKYTDGSEVGFELGRIVDPMLSEVLNLKEPRNGEVTVTTDSSEAIVRRKLGKTYEVPFPVELLLHREDPNISTDDMIVPTIRPLCKEEHGFVRVWYMGNAVECLYERS